MPDVDDMVSCGTDFMSTITGMTGAPSAIANEASLDINLPFNQSFSNNDAEPRGNLLGKKRGRPKKFGAI